MAYTYVLLDADDTLFDFVKAERHCIHGVLERCGAASPQGEQLFVSINQGLWRRLERGEVSAERLRVLRFEELFAKLGVSLPPQEGAALYLQFLAESCFLLPEALAVVQTLARRRIPVAVVMPPRSAAGTTCWMNWLIKARLASLLMVPSSFGTIRSRMSPILAASVMACSVAE